MKGLAKTVLCLALSWLAVHAGAQETQFNASRPKNAEASESTIRAQTSDITVQPPPPSWSGTNEPIQKPLPKTDIKPVRLTVSKVNSNSAPPSPVMDNLSVKADNLLGTNDRCCATSCWQDCLSSGAGCQDRGRFWGTAEYLMFWQRSDNVPPLVTSSPVGTSAAVAGKLGQPTTSVLYDELPNPIRSGGRIAIGMWLPDIPILGLEVNALFLGREGDSSTFTSNGDPKLFRPFFSANTNSQAAEIVAVPGTPGAVTVSHFSQMYGIEANVRYNWCCGSDYWVDVILGYRHLNLSEGIDINESPKGFNITDSFQTRSQFNGFQAGMDSEWCLWNCLFIGTTGKLAIGSTHEIININGSTTFASNGRTLPGGLLALPTNIGGYSNDKFAVLPELSVKVGCDINYNLRVFFGYDLLYLSAVVRPGEQIDPVVNTNLLPTAAGPGFGGGPLRPAVLFKTTDYWAQGLNFGVYWQY